MKTMSRVRRMAVALLGLASVSAAWPITGAQREIVRLLTDPTAVHRMVLSPDGKHLAVLTNRGLGGGMMMLDAETLGGALVIQPRHVVNNYIYERQPEHAYWVANDLLAVDFNDDETELVGLDGVKKCELGERFVRQQREGGQRSDWVLVQRNVKKHSLSRVNIRTCQKQDYDIDLEGELRHWAFDRQGRLRAATTFSTHMMGGSTRVFNWYRADEKSPWQRLSDNAVTDDFFTPLFVPDEPHRLVVLSAQGRDTDAVVLYDTESHRPVDLMAGHPSEDIVRVESSDTDEILRVDTQGMLPQTYWFDERWDRLQRSLEAALPGHRVTIDGNLEGRVLVGAYSDVDPGRWYLLDVPSMKLREIARRRPMVDDSLAQPMKVIRYPSLDGLMIPAYLTRAARPALGPQPLVVYLHGGPQSRDYWGWDAEVQILAANGYAVFQPQFRGSAGFGKHFEEAGFGEWGRAMQDDVTAGVRYLIDHKIADPQRICTFGASYGGYAALWGLVKTPELYHCGISMAGVTDINEMFTDWSDSNVDTIAKQFRRLSMGDPAAMKPRYAEMSPQRHADRIQAPVLLMHGEMDVRVPVGHSRRMARALQDAGKVYRTSWFPDAGHGFRYLADHRRYLVEVLDFLDKYIKPDPEAQPKNKAPAPAVPASSASSPSSPASAASAASAASP